MHERLATVLDICHRIEAADTPPGTAELAGAVGWSERHLHRVFTAIVGVSPRVFGEWCRARRVTTTLAANGSVTDTVFASGYGSLRAFYDGAGTRLGMSPGRFAAGGAGETIRTTVVAGPIGEILVAATDGGICAVRIGPDGGSLLDELRRDLPRAEFVPGADTLTPVVEVVLALASARAPGDATLPIDVAATGFQAEVWQAIRRIPAGEVQTYAELAASLGRPTATRAVARACATNPVALVVPCHRVVRTDGGLGGYRWGIEVKASLLATERGAAPTQVASPR